MYVRETNVGAIEERERERFSNTCNFIFNITFTCVCVCISFVFVFDICPYVSTVQETLDACGFGHRFREEVASEASGRRIRRKGLGIPISY